ncbi:SDR family NAD(P)-dependent oxidoreductase [Streptomyces sp. NPDC058280]|uniref:SDR family NAD(P)-dependent oxidoreductase n=1 Tax=Streptomyces sp. NPDC058280 TaxID=3346419 RepID=UPI0036E5DD7D
MARVLITGSADGLGLMAARLLIRQGHGVTLHARDTERGEDARAALPDAEGVVTGDLSSLGGMRAVAEGANACGRFDAVVHNAGIGYREARRVGTEDGLCHVFAVNVLAPYVLTALITRPDRLVYLSSGMARHGQADLSDPQWTRRLWNGAQAYSDSKLLDMLLARAVAEHWPGVLSNSVEPGWVPTKMGGPGAPDDLALGPVTQAWLAVSDEPSATLTGEHFFHQRRHPTPVGARSHQAGRALLGYCAGLTGIALPARQ